MIYLYLFGTCFHFIYVFMIIGNIRKIIHEQYHPANGTDRSEYESNIGFPLKEHPVSSY